MDLNPNESLSIEAMLLSSTSLPHSFSKYMQAHACVLYNYPELRL